MAVARRDGSARGKIVQVRRDASCALVPVDVRLLAVVGREDHVVECVEWKLGGRREAAEAMGPARTTPGLRTGRAAAQVDEAAEAMLLGNRMTGADAARLGLVNRAVPADELDATVDGFVADLLAGGPGALAATKQLLSRVPTMSVEDAFAWTAELSAELFSTDEAREGMRAFLEKRPPTWAD